MKMKMKEKEMNVDLEPTTRKIVDDLGAAAYLMMMGWKVLGRKDKAYVFEIEESLDSDFEDTHLEYLNSDFHRFDASVMSLKKLHNQVR